jgi:hypothetical protein
LPETEGLPWVSGIQIGFGLLKPVAKLLGAFLVLWLLVATYGLDLSPGFLNGPTAKQHKRTTSAFWGKADIDRSWVEVWL